MGQTIAEKIISAHTGTTATANDIVLADVDLVFCHDANRPHPIDVMVQMGGTRLFDPRQVALLLDHYVSPVESVANLHQRMRTFTQTHGAHLFEAGHGISHQLLPENGFIKPGMLIAGADSHSCTYGALNAMSFGMGSSDIAAAMISGKVWLKVPESYKVQIEGALPPGVFSKDLILYIIAHFGAGGTTYRSVEFHGSTIENLSIDARLTIANMAIEMGAKAGLMLADEKTQRYLTEHGVSEFTPVAPDPQADYALITEIDAAGLTPQVALPHRVDQVKPVDAVAGQPIQQVVIGTCTNARIEDFRIAAHILAGQQIHPDVKLFIVPSSRGVMGQAIREGLLAIFHQAGAIIGVPGCNGCVGGAHFAVPPDGVHMVTTANRNFKGRTGNPNAFIYLTSPATAAATALTGRLTDPRPYFDNGWHN